jgi:hypothetical protein
MSDNFSELRRTEIRSEQRRPIAKLQFNQESIKPQNQNQSSSNNPSSQEKKS